MFSIDYFGLIVSLSLTFILCSLLYFYLNKKILILEDSLLNQARVLQNFISTTMQNQFINVPSNQLGGVASESINPFSDNSNQQSEINNLDRINVSDDEEEESSGDESSDDESGEDESGEDESGEDDESGEEEQEKQEEKGASEIKLIDVSNLETFEIQELHLDNNENSEDEDDEDDDDEDEDDDDDDEDNTEEDNSQNQSTEEYNKQSSDTIQSNLEEVVSKIEGTNDITQVSEKINFKKMPLNDLRKYAEERNLIEKGSKITKKNLLIKLEQ